MPGYVHPEKPDVFISYAQNDDRPLPPAAVGWVTRFVQIFKEKLGQTLGRRQGEFKVWWDHNLPIGARLTPDIQRQLSDSAVIVIFLSRSYLNSEWCNAEMELFLDKEIRDRKGPGSPVFVVELDRVIPRPPALSDILSISFWETDAQNENARRLGTPLPQETDRVYYNRHDDLARDIARELDRQIAEKRNPPPPPDGDHHAPVVPPAETGPVVYLAEVRAALEEHRNEIKRTLDQYGYRVVPRVRLPGEQAEFEAAVRAELKEAVLFVQVLDAAPGSTMDDTEVRRARHQYDLACDPAHRVPVMQWRSRAIDPAKVENPPHREMLEKAEFIDEDPVGFRSEVLKRIEKLLAPPEVAPPDGDAPEICIDAEPCDMAVVDGIAEMLEKRGLNVLRPSRSEEPEKVRKKRELNLTRCHGLVLVNGPNPEWVHNYRDLVSKFRAKRSAPLKATALWDGPPPGQCDPSCIWFKTGCASADRDPFVDIIRGMHVIDCRSHGGTGCTETDGFKKFLASVRNG